MREQGMYFGQDTDTITDTTYRHHELVTGPRWQIEGSVEAPDYVCETCGQRERPWGAGIDWERGCREALVLETALDLLARQVEAAQTADAAVRAWSAAAAWLRHPDPMLRPPFWAADVAEAAEIGARSAHAACRPIGGGMLRRR